MVDSEDADSNSDEDILSSLKNSNKLKQSKLKNTLRFDDPLARIISGSSSKNVLDKDSDSLLNRNPEKKENLKDIKKPTPLERSTSLSPSPRSNLASPRLTPLTDSPRLSSRAREDKISPRLSQTEKRPSLSSKEIKPLSGISSSTLAGSPPLSGRSPPFSGRSPPISGRSPPLSARSPPISGRSPPLSTKSPPLSGRSPPSRLLTNSEKDASSRLSSLSNMPELSGAKSKRQNSLSPVRDRNRHRPSAKQENENSEASWKTILEHSEDSLKFEKENVAARRKRFSDRSSISGNVMGHISEEDNSTSKVVKESVEESSDSDGFLMSKSSTSRKGVLDLMLGGEEPKKKPEQAIRKKSITKQKTLPQKEDSVKQKSIEEKMKSTLDSMTKNLVGEEIDVFEDDVSGPKLNEKLEENEDEMDNVMEKPKKKAKGRSTTPFQNLPMTTTLKLFKMPSTREMEFGEDPEKSLSSDILLDQTFIEWYNRKIPHLKEKKLKEKEELKKKEMEMQKAESKKKEAETYFNMWKKAKDAKLIEEHRRKTKEEKEKKAKEDSELRDKKATADSTIKAWDEKKKLQERERRKQKRKEQENLTENEKEKDKEKMPTYEEWLKNKKHQIALESRKREEEEHKNEEEEYQKESERRSSRKSYQEWLDAKTIQHQKARKKKILSNEINQRPPFRPNGRY